MKIVNSIEQIQKANRVLIHEHVFCRSRTANNPIVIKYLPEQFKMLSMASVDLMVDVTAYTTPGWIADVPTTNDLSVACCAGYYTERFVPRNLRSKPSEELARLLIAKIRRGIGSAGFRPFVLKCGSGGKYPSATEKRTIAAVSIANNETSIPVQVHSCDGAEEQFDIIKNNSGRNNFMYCHVEMGMKTGRRLNLESVLTRALRILDRGNFIMVNDIGVTRSEYQVAVLTLLRSLVERGYSEQICVATDSNWAVRPGRLLVRGVDQNKSSARKYSYLLDNIIPTLLKAGIDDVTVEKLCFYNGKRFLLS